MLKEIWSTAFKANGQTRPPIRFNSGLSVIRGTDQGTNSIGKSSLLLAIDFAFGGETYVGSEAPKEAGHHTVCWTMEFDRREYYFGRSTQSPDHILVCDSAYVLTGKSIEIKEYCEKLASRYGIKLSRTSWRQLRTTFFRIYGKDNMNEKDPLQGWKRASKEVELRPLLGLYGYYEALAPYDKRREETKEAFSAFKTAQEYRFIPQTGGGTKELSSQQQRIEELEAIRETAINNNGQQVSTSEVDDEQHRLDLRRRLNATQRELANLERRIELARMTEKYGVRVDEADLLALQEFFPNVELRKLHEVERFHAQLASVLEGEAAEERTALEQRRTELDDQYATLRAELLKLGPGPGYTREFLDTIKQIDEEIGDLKSKTNAAEQFHALDSAKRKAKREYDQAVAHSLSMVETTLNTAMRRLSEEIVGNEYNPPEITISAFNSFTFHTPHDQGAGTGCRGLTIYDFAVLETSALPAIAHDTNILKQCDDKAVEGIMEQYGAATKQIFLAFDRADRYTQRVNDIVDQYTVIQLGPDEQTLFGKAWNKRDE